MGEGIQLCSQQIPHGRNGSYTQNTKTLFFAGCISKSAAIAEKSFFFFLNIVQWVCDKIQECVERRKIKIEFFVKEP